MKFKEIYDFSVLSELRGGKQINVFDKKEMFCEEVGNLTVNELMNVLRASEEEKDRYLFYTVEEKKENENE